MKSDRLEKLCFPPPLAGGAPWLVYQHRNTQTFSTIWPQNKSYSKTIPELLGKCIIASYYGWLLLQDDDYFDDLRLWNPMTMEAIPLPPLPDIERIDTCVLTSSPDHDDDFAVFVFSGHLVLFCCPISDQEPRWRDDQLRIEDKQVRIYRAVSCNRVVYAWARIINSNGSIQTLLFTIKLDIESSNSVKMTSLELDEPLFHGLSYECSQSYFLESCARVYHVLVTTGDALHQRINGVKVWELDLENMRWVEVKSLNDRAFFLSHDDCSTWCWAGPGAEGNSIYFHSVDIGDGIDNTLYQYRLGDRSLTRYLPPLNLRSPWEEPIWFARPSRKAGIQKVNIFNKNANITNSVLPKDNGTMEHLFNSAPGDIIALISDYLHWFDYLDFRITCKSIHSVLSPSRYQWRATCDNSLPLFVSLKNYDGLFQVMDVFRNDSRSISIPKSKTGAYHIKFSKDGWVILESCGESFHFFNIFTRVRGYFPPCETGSVYLLSIGFSTSPTSSDCVTVAMYGWNFFTICYIGPGNQDWQYAKFDYGREIFPPSTCPPVYHNGGFYFLDKRGRVGVFELVGEEPSWKLYGRPQTRNMLFHSFHLLECEGQLFSVFIGKSGAWIQVFRFDDTEKNWVRVKSIGKHVFFVSPSSSTSAIASGIGMGNRIYLPNLQDSRFLFYSLETRKCHVIGAEFTMENFCPSEQPFECCWVN